MFSGIAPPYGALPVVLIEKHDLHGLDLAGDGRGGRLGAFRGGAGRHPRDQGAGPGSGFAIQKGVQGLAIRNEQGRAVVFPHTASWGAPHYRTPVVGVKDRARLPKIPAGRRE
jgi:hypothetical protein